MNQFEALTDRVACRWLAKVARNSPEDSVRYVAVFIPAMQAKRLIRRFGQKHPNLFAHHMTIWHFEDGPVLDYSAIPWGRTVSLKVVGYAEDEKAQVIIVSPPSGLKPKGRIAHVTLSTSEGVAPAYSNQLIAANPHTGPVKGLPAIDGRVGWWDGEKERFDHPT